MKEFLQAIESHQDTAMGIALFIAVMTWIILDGISDIIKSRKK